MYHGYTESEEKIEARKRRILGAGAPPETQPMEGKENEKVEETRPNEWRKPTLLMMATLYPIAFFLGSLLGELIQELVR